MKVTHCGTYAFVCLRSTTLDPSVGSEVSCLTTVGVLQWCALSPHGQDRVTGMSHDAYPAHAQTDGRSRGSEIHGALLFCGNRYAQGYPGLGCVSGWAPGTPATLAVEWDRRQVYSVGC